MIEPPIGQIGIPEPPEYIKTDEVALGFWHKHTKELDMRQGGFQTAWGSAMAEFCKIEARMIRLHANIDKHGELVLGERGMVKNPAHQILRDLGTQKVKYVEMFGLAPAAQYRLNLPDAVPDDDHEFEPPTAFVTQ